MYANARGHLSLRSPQAAVIEVVVNLDCNSLAPATDAVDHRSQRLWSSLMMSAIILPHQTKHKYVYVSQFLANKSAKEFIGVERSGC